MIGVVCVCAMKQGHDTTQRKCNAVSCVSREKNVPRLNVTVCRRMSPLVTTPSSFAVLDGRPVRTRRHLRGERCESLLRYCVHILAKEYLRKGRQDLNSDWVT